MGVRCRHGFGMGPTCAGRLRTRCGELPENRAPELPAPVRTGERDFALLLEGPTTTEIALSRAQQLVASGLRNHSALPGGTTLKFNIAVALLPENGLAADRSIQWLIENLNAIPADARKPIRAVNF